MTWYAVAAVDDAVDAARGFLFPFSPVRWAKLAILVLFMGGGVSYNVQVPFSPRGALTGEVPTGAGPTAGPGDLPIGGDALIVIAAVVAVVAVLLSVLSLALRFVFYDALRTDEVRLWNPLKNRIRQAIRLFLFQLGLLLLVVGPLAGAGYAAVQQNVRLDTIGLAAAIVLGLAVGVVFLLLALVLQFTQEFVLPVMVLTDAGPLAAWREFWPTLREEWLQYLGYLLVHLLLAIGIAIAEGVVVIVLAGIVIALGAILGLVVVGFIGGIEAVLASAVGIVTLAGIGLVVVVTLLVILLPIRIVVTTYLTCYELLVLGGTNREFMLLPESVIDAPDAFSDDSGGVGPTTEQNG